MNETTSNPSKRTLLIVEDDPGLQSQMRWCFDDSIEVLTADNINNAIAHIRRSEPSVVTLDLGLPPDPGGSSIGLSLLEEILAIAPRTKVIIITGQEENELAIKAIGNGAYDYYQKPIDGDLLSFVVERAFKVHALEEANLKLSTRHSSSLEGLIANSETMLKVCKTVEKVAPTDLTTLILGETGTGKEVLAQAIHDNSNRSSAGFHAINCAAIPENLLESELFGYEKGAFTGATKQKKGKIELAKGGTLFLDEMGDMPMALQSKMLRFLQERVIERVGGHEPIPVDVRVICATHRDLQQMITEETFREDLYYRISEITIKVPPLREREGDAMLLARSLLAKYTAQHKRKIVGFTEKAIAAIETYRWPGNVREMVNKIKRATVMADSNLITQEDLELTLSEDDEAPPLNLREVRDRAEKQAVLRALTNCGNNVAQSARMLGITRPTLYNLLNKFEIEVSGHGEKDD